MELCMRPARLGNNASPPAFFLEMIKRRTLMKKLALGLVAAATICTAVPAMAQVGFFAGPGGVGVGLGVPGPYYNCGYGYPCNRGYYDYYGGGPNVVVGGGWQGRGRGHRHWHH